MDEFLTVDEVAKILRLAPYTIREYAKAGLLPAYKTRRQWRFKKTEIEEWLNSQRKEMDGDG
jgi:excisionase family DNA binding protein